MLDLADLVTVGRSCGRGHDGAGPGGRTLRKVDNVPSGHDPSQYVTRRLLALAPDGNLYVAEGGNQMIRKIAPDGTVTTLAGGALQPVQSGKVSMYGALLFGAAAVGALVLVLVNS